MPAYASGTCFWISLFSAINPGVRTIPRKPCGVPLNHAQEIQEEHSVRELRDTVLRGLQEELANLRLRDGAADHQESLDSILDRLNMLFEGYQVQLDDLHFIAWLSGKRNPKLNLWTGPGADLEDHGT